MPYYCCIPGCEQKKKLESRKTGTIYKYAHFNAPNPRFVRTKERADWAKELKGIILRFRDPAKDNILDMFHRDLVKICERHFADDDIVYKQGSDGALRKMLKPGALPTLEFPTKSGLLLPNPYVKHIPKVQRMGLLSSTRSPTKVIEKTFSCLVENARLLENNKMWDINIGKDLVTFSKLPKTYDQSELVIAVNKEFKIWISYYGWSLPPGHRLTEMSLQKRSLLTFLNEVDSESLCDGVSLPEGITQSKLRNCHEHVITKSSEPFTHGFVQKHILTSRSTDCEVLLSKSGVCKACLDRMRLAQKIHERETKEAAFPFSIVLRDKPSDSFLVKRLKMALRSKGATLGRADNELAKKRSKQASTTEEQSKKEKFKNEMIDIFLKYRKSIGASPMFDEFWKVQLEVITQQARPGSPLRFADDLIGFLCDIFRSESRVYERFRDSKLLVLPTLKSMRACRRKREKHMQEVIMGVSQPTDDPASLAPLLHPSTYTVAVENAMTLNSATAGSSAMEDDTELADKCEEKRKTNMNGPDKPYETDTPSPVRPEGRPVDPQEAEKTKTMEVDSGVSAQPKIVIEVVKGPMCRQVGKSSPKRRKMFQTAPAGQSPVPISSPPRTSLKSDGSASVQYRSPQGCLYQRVQTKRISDGSLIVTMHKMSEGAKAIRKANQKRSHSNAFLFPVYKTPTLIPQLTNGLQLTSSDDDTRTAATVPEIT